MKSMKKLFILISLMTLSSLLVPPVWATDVSGHITTNTTWNLAGSPYVVTATVYVDNGVTLTVDPGVTVKFNSNTNIEIDGTMNADGDASHIITFTSNQGTPAGNDWRALYFNNGTGLLDNCLIQYAGASWSCAIYLLGTANVVIDSTIIRECGLVGARNEGIYTTGSSHVNVSYTQIYNCGWPVRLYGSYLPIFGAGNNFTGNENNGIWNQISTINGTQTMYNPGVPYAHVSEDLTVASGAQLTINPGCILKFEVARELIVNGTLIADADAVTAIYMTSFRDDNWGGDTNGNGSANAPAIADWDGVRFTTTATSSCLMDYVQLRFAGYSSGGGVEIQTSSPNITYCQINNCYYGIYITGVCSSNINYNTIGVSTMTPIALTFESFPTFNDNDFSSSDNGYDAIGILSGTLTANAYLPQRDVIGIPNVTYVLLGSVTVPAAYTLTIEGGCVIKIPATTYQLLIQGNLIADGNADSVIVFTSVKDDNYGNPGDTNNDGSITSPAPGDWWRIYFDNPSYRTGGTLDYCRITYGGSTYSSNRAAVIVDFCSPTITNCYFSDCQRGITLYGNSNPYIADNDFLNTTYEPLELSASSNPTFGGGDTMTNVGYFALGILPETVAVDGTIRVKNFAGYNNITYVLSGDWTVASGTRVTVEPNIVIKSITSSTRMVINGTFIVDVPSYQQVVFTSVKDDNYGNPGDTNDDGSTTSPAHADWNYIGFYDTSLDDSCRIVNARILYGDESIYTQNAGPKIDHCYISDGTNALYIAGNSNPKVWNNDIRNTYSVPIMMSLLSDPDFSGNTLTSCAYNALGVVEGTLNSNAVMKRRNVAGFNPIAYLSTSSTTVSASARLSIQPGVVWKWVDQYRGLYVYGKLFAEGKAPADSQIVFTSIHDDAYGGDTNNNGNSTSPSVGNWQYIYFGDTAVDDSCRMRNCKILYASGAYVNSGIAIESSSPTIDSCDLEFLYFAIEIYGDAAPHISNCLINACNYAPIYMDMFSQPVFSGNTFYNCQYSAIAIRGQSYSQNNTVPIRNFGGYTNITYLIWSDLTVNSGTWITIPPSVVFKFYGSRRITVNGVLKILGPDPQRPGVMPVFTSYKDDRYGNPMDTNNDGSTTTPACDNWYAIYFNDVSDDANCIVDSAIIAYSSYGVLFNSAGCTVQNSILEHNSYGFYLAGNSNPNLIDDEVRQSCYSPVKMSLTSNPNIQNNNYHNNAFQALELIGETMASNATIPVRNVGGDSNIVYLLYNTTLTVGTNAILTIDPGVVIKSYASSIIVRRGLHAFGGATPDSQIVFTSYRDDFYGGDTNQDSNATAPARGNWYYIQFDDQALDPECTMNHCVVRYAQYSTYGAVYCVNASPTVTNSRISDNYYGVYASGNSNPVLTGNDFFNNNQYGVYNAGSSFCINATNCWWGASSGPLDNSNTMDVCGGLYNPSGTGDRVTNNVDYSSWRTLSGNPIMGDVSLNGTVHAYDATLVLLYVANPITNPLTALQQMVAEVSGNGTITGYDASLILQYVAGIISVFPAEIDEAKNPGIRPTLPVIAAVDGRLSMATLSAQVGQEITMPVSIEYSGDLYSAQFTVNYNPSLLQFEAVDLSSALAGFQIQTSNNNGTLRIVVANAYPATSSGDLMNLRFRVADDVHGKVATNLTFTDVMLNESEATILGAGSIDIIGLPTDYSLGQNYPNPFNPITTIPYALPKADQVTIVIYNIQGQLVQTLIDKRMEAGNHVVIWDGKDSRGISMASGIYFVRMKAGDFLKVHKMTLLK